MSPTRPVPRRRGWIVTRALAAADAAGLLAAFALAELVFGHAAGDVDETAESLLFVATLPGWLVGAKLYELYDLDEERTGHTTLGDLRGVFHLVTVGTWVFFATSWTTGIAEPDLRKIVAFWVAAIVLVCTARAAARTVAHRTRAYVQNVVVVGTDPVARLVARKLAQHPEYGLRVAGFVDDVDDTDDDPDRPARLGRVADLPLLAALRAVERVVVAFPDDETAAAAVASAGALGLQVDIVPRLHELVGPNVLVHDVEGLPLVALPALKPFPFSRALKAAFDRSAAAAGLVVLAPLLALVALLVRLDSPGPALFRQTRLGEGMRPFTLLKFRTMRVGAGDDVHRAYIASTMRREAADGAGLYKLDRADAVTRVGRVLRRTSLDELPQLVNVLRGEMSLVGPRPCIPYEVDHFEPRHFARFDVPAGITGLWQVTARAHATFREALDMDVAYARSWSLGLDLRLLLATPAQLVRQRRGTA